MRNTNIRNGGKWPGRPYGTKCSCHFTSRSVNRVSPFSGACRRCFRVFISTNFSSSLGRPYRRERREDTVSAPCTFSSARSFHRAACTFALRGQIFARSSLGTQKPKEEVKLSSRRGFSDRVLEGFLTILKFHRDYRI